MTASMRRANVEGAYFLTDSSTFIAERGNVPELSLLFRGGEMLVNPYHTLYLSAPTPGTPTARKFGDFLLSERGQALMRGFGKATHGKAMYNDAATTARMIGE
jgi:tungstate transport system substrate-binding protein